MYKQPEIKFILIVVVVEILRDNGRSERGRS